MDALYDTIDHQVDVILHVCSRVSKHWYTATQVTYRSAKEGVLLVYHPPSSDGRTARALAVQAMRFIRLVVGERVLASMSVSTTTLTAKC